MVGALIGAGLGLAGSIYGGIKAGNERRKMNRQLDRQDAENTAWYNANALSDYTQRADAQNVMRQLRDTLGKQNKRAAQSAVVTGATPEQQAVQKEQSNKVISDTFAGLGAAGQQWKDNITNRYLARKDNIAQQRMGVMEGAAQSAETLQNNGLNVLMGSAGNIFPSVGNPASAAAVTTQIPS